MRIIKLCKSLLWNLRQWSDVHRNWLIEVKDVGKNVRIATNVKISHPQKMKIGDGVIIEHGTIINSSSGVEIGGHSVISSYCSIWTGNHRYYDGVLLPYDNDSLNDNVLIGECVWIGHKVVIVPGVEIGEGVVVVWEPWSQEIYLLLLWLVEIRQRLLKCVMKSIIIH